MKQLFIFFIIINYQLSIINCKAQDTLGIFEFSPTLNQTRVNSIKYTTLILYPVSMYWLYTQWYENYPQNSFHFFNDRDEWLQMDKAGHVFTSYAIGKGYSGLLRWAGVDRRRASWYGVGMGLLYQTTIEVFDGFSSQWGFSPGDMTANVIGSGIFMCEELLWNEQRINLKFSFHQTEYAQYRPNQLGSSLAESWLKDYNGQTYWVSVNPSMFMNKDSKFPKWLSIAGGYGAEGMTGARENPTTVNGEAIPSFDRYRQYYISLDVAINRIKTKSRFIHAIGEIFGIIKFPAPTLEFNQGHAGKFYWFYF